MLLTTVIVSEHAFYLRFLQQRCCRPKDARQSRLTTAIHRRRSATDKEEPLASDPGTFIRTYPDHVDAGRDVRDYLECS